MDAAKSAGPKMMVSRRGDAAQISSTLIRPRVVSICASMPMCPAGRPALVSTCDSNRSSAITSAADCTFGSITSSRRMPAWPTTSITSNTVHSVSHTLMRTHRTLSPQSWVLIALTTLVRGLLLERRHRVFEIEEHHVGGEAGGLAEHLLARPGDGQTRAARQLTSACGHGRQPRRPTYAPPP